MGNCPRPPGPDHQTNVYTAQATVRRALLEVGLLEREDGGESFSTPANREVLRWIGDAIRRRQSEREMRTAFSRICKTTNSRSEPIGHVLARFSFVREGVWRNRHSTLRDLIRNEDLADIPRRTLVALFDCCEAVWVTAEHAETSAAEDLWRFVAGERVDVPLPERFRANAMTFAERTLTRMSRMPSRGGGIRRARRLISRRVAAYHDAPPVDPGTAHPRGH